MIVSALIPAINVAKVNVETRMMAKRVDEILVDLWLQKCEEVSVCTNRSKSNKTTQLDLRRLDSLNRRSQLKC